MRGVLDTTVCDKECHWVTVCYWCSVGSAVFSIISSEFGFSPMWGKLDTAIWHMWNSMSGTNGNSVVFVQVSWLPSVLNWTPKCYWNIAKYTVEFP